MIIQRIQPPLRAVAKSIQRAERLSLRQVCLNEAFGALSVHCDRAAPTLVFTRHAHHAAQGAVNSAKDGPGKRLGAKKSGEQYVIPGNIIFKQRGTKWFPGEHCAMGRDHTIYATHHGYVKYYKDPEKHPDRQYIGVVFERDDVLPTPRNATRRRRLGMIAETMEVSPIVTSGDEPLPGTMAANPSPPSAWGRRPAPKPRKSQAWRELAVAEGYMYRETNWSIGRTAERAQVRVKEFKPGNRWLAWRKRETRKVASAEKRTLLSRRKGKKVKA